MSCQFDQWLEKLSAFEKNVKNLPNFINYGYLVKVHGLILEVIGLRVPIGTCCIIEKMINNSTTYVSAEVINFAGEKILLFSFDETHGMYPGARVIPIFQSSYTQKQWPLSVNLLGRVLDSIGKPLDGFPDVVSDSYSSTQNMSINPLKRKPIVDVLDTGIRAINGLLTVGRGQRIGLFSSSGVGKSILLGMMAKYTKADVIVIALIGERGREVKEFIENILGVDGLSRSVVIAAPADISPIFQVKGAFYATKIAEFFRDQNKHVLLIMDSLTRYAMAQREISLSIGEFPVDKGYSSSVFSKISHLVERAGNTHSEGSITSFYTVLTEHEEEQDPIGHISRSILDGHIVLSRYYADLGHYPAIDIEASISRIMPNITSFKHYSHASYFKKLLASYQRNKDLVNVGAYISGTDPILDHAIKIWKKIEQFLQQNILEKSDYISSCQELDDLFI